MVWNKLKQQLESFLSPTIHDRISYLPSGYRYTPGKASHCYITVDKVEVFNKAETTKGIKWYESEQDIINDPEFHITVTEEDIELIRLSNNKIPNERLPIIAMERKKATCAKGILKAQNELYKTDFQKTGIKFLSESIETSLESDEILRNVFALIDRRVGKKRLISLNNQYEMKHPIVRFFYDLRIKG